MHVEQLRTFVKMLITEGIYEHEATEASRNIVAELKRQLEQADGLKKALEFDVSVPDAIDAKKIVVSVARKANITEPYVEGKFEWDENALDENIVYIYIHAPRKWERYKNVLKQLNVLIPELKSVLRHEFEHSKQSFEELESIRGYNLKKFEDIRAYFMNPAEYGPRISGLRKKAKTLHTNMRDVMYDEIRDIGNMAKNAGASDEQVGFFVMDVFNAWNDYAKKRFPKAFERT